jgi:uncharacterized SAM-binding protein YcdF (DUF218 family)
MGTAMFVFSKIFISLVTPPGLFWLLLLCVFLLFRFKKQQLAQRLLLVVAGFGYALSTEPVRDALLLPLENAYPAYQSAPAPAPASAGPVADYVVVLGGGIVDHSPEEAGRATIAPDPLKRLVYAFTLCRQLKLPLIIAGGRVLKGEEVESEAEASVRLLERLGMPIRDILIEDQSRNTWENANNVKARYHPQHVLLVTSTYHMPRSMLCFSRSGLNAVAAPTDYKVARSHYIVTSFFPDMRAFKDSFTALKEYFGLAYSWFALPQLQPVQALPAPTTPAPVQPAQTRIPPCTTVPGTHTPSTTAPGTSVLSAVIPGTHTLNTAPRAPHSLAAYSRIDFYKKICL